MWIQAQVQVGKGKIPKDGCLAVHVPGCFMGLAGLLEMPDPFGDIYIRKCKNIEGVAGPVLVAGLLAQFQRCPGSPARFLGVPELVLSHGNDPPGTPFTGTITGLLKELNHLIGRFEGAFGLPDTLLGFPQAQQAGTEQ